LIGVRTGARHADGRLGGLGSEHCLEGIPAPATATVLFQPKQKLNQTKQIRKYIFMENTFYQQGSNSHPEGMRHRFPFFSPSFFHTISLSPAFTGA
jgi:hypothetical protein